jgi:hypothetical protein
VLADSVARPERFPAPSTASTPSEYAVPHVSPANVKDVPVPVDSSVPFR